MPRATKRSPAKTARPSRPLEKYGEKRDFAVTPEPGPRHRPSREGPLTFVIQKHAASRLHYDFRLEFDGVMKSWSVPKGPSLNPADKHLAVMVEDHPLDYASFEGVIPKGQYGAGQVIVWDNGTYSPDEDGLSFDDTARAEERMRGDLANGKLSITMRGRKLKGSWTLVKMQDGDTNWLLIKHRDLAASEERDILEQDRSVFSNLSIEDIQSGLLPDRSQPLPPLRPNDAHGAKQASLAASIAPMLATPVEKPFSDAAWFFEPKLDGVRVIALIDRGSVRLLSRSGLDATKQYPSIAAELPHQPAAQLVLDGEIVALNERGVPSFELLQQRLNLTRDTDIRRAEEEVPIQYYVFDLLHLDGYDLRGVVLKQRREFLERVLLPTDRVRLVEPFDVGGEVAYDAAIKHGLEGVVAKRRESVYESGRRSKAWLKIKGTHTDEFVVAGFSAGQGARSDTFGALILGQYEDGKLVYTGHVGSGFNDKLLRDLRVRLEKIVADRPPFDGPIPEKTRITWLKPQVVVEVKFAERTREGYLRAPVFVRLRDDKPASDVSAVSAVEALEESDLPPAAGGTGDIVEQLSVKKEKLLLEVDGYKIGLTNLDKQLWTGMGRKRALTKRDYLRYLAVVAPYLVPHLRDRPLTLVRYPNGIAQSHFYQKHWGNPLPEFVETVRLYSSSTEENQEYIICNNLATLLWLGQIADLELHTWYSRVSPEPDGHHLTTDFDGSVKRIESSLLNYPDFIVFDLDPYVYSGKEAKGGEPELNRKAFAKTCEVARWLKDVLDSLSLSTFIKTTGKTGLHIYVPILRELDYDAARAASETIGRFVLEQHPKDVTMEWATEKRTGKIFIDHNQNVRGKTLASIYSPRALPGAPVSMPLRWDELDSVYPTDFTILTAPERLAKTGDLWANILDAKHDIQALLGNKEPSKRAPARKKTARKRRT